MKKNYFKKSLSLIMTVLMLMSCWVFVAPELNEVSAIEYNNVKDYNLSLVNGLSAINTSVTTTRGSFEYDADYVSDANYAEVYKNVLYSPIVQAASPAATTGTVALKDSKGADSIRWYHPVTTLIYDGVTTPQFGIVMAVDAYNNCQVRTYSGYIAGGNNGLSFVNTYWRGKDTRLNFMWNYFGNASSTVATTDGSVSSTYCYTSDKSADWYYANAIKFSGTMNDTEYVRTITPTWGWKGNQASQNTGSVYTYTKASSNSIYIINYKPVKAAMEQVNTWLAAIKANPAKYSTRSVVDFVNVYNKLAACRPNAYVTATSNNPSGYSSAASAAMSAYNSFSLEERVYDIQAENLFSFADWYYSKSNTATSADVNAGTLSIVSDSSKAEVTTAHSSNSTRNQNMYAIPVTGGQNYTVEWTTSCTSENSAINSEVFLFFYNVNNQPFSTWASFSPDGKSSGKNSGTVTAPADAKYMELRFDNNNNKIAETMTFSNIKVYKESRGTEISPADWISGLDFRKVYSYNGTVGNIEEPTRKGYIFDGWQVDTDGDGVGDYNVQTTDPISQSWPLYSTWSKKTLDVNYDNLFSLSDWSYTNSNKGNPSATGLNVDLEAGTIAVTGMTDAYTTYGGGSDQYHVPVTAGEEYIFDYDVASTNGTYQAFVFFYDDNGAGVKGATYNGAVQPNPHIGRYDAQPLIFTVPEGCTNIGIRVGICGSTEGTATYSNIGIYKKAAYDAYASGYDKVRVPFKVGDTTNLMYPSRDGYVFDGWEKADGTKIENVTGLKVSETVYATWTKLWTVTFLNGDGSVLGTATVKDGAAATAPAQTPVKDSDDGYSYEFSSWNEDFSNVTADMTVNPKFTSTAHTVTYTVVSARTCETNAIVDKYCSGCGYIFFYAEEYDGTTETAWLKLGHSYDSNRVVTGSTTGEDGNHKIECVRYLTCGSTQSAPHNYAQGTTDNADCVTPGTVNWRCPCGQTKTTTGDIAPDVHNSTTTINAEAATCTEEGYTGDTYCSDCDTIVKYGTTIGKLDHSFTDYVYNNDAECEVDGSETAKCDRCDVTDTQTATGTALKHKWEDTEEYLKTAANCTDDEVYYKECSLCGISSESKTGATWTKASTKWNHKFDGDYVANNDGTHVQKCTNRDCTATGNEQNCTYGAWTTDNATTHSHTCTACGYTPAAENHSWTAWKTVDGETTTAPAEQTRSCEVCGITESKDCTYETTHYDATCTTPERTEYKCSDCNHGYSVIGEDATGHNFSGEVKSYNNGTHAFLCANDCGSYGFNGIANAKTNCSYSYTNTASGTHKAECTVCTYSYSEDCSGGQATCTEEAVCDKCNTAYGDKADHSFNGAAVKLEGDVHAYLCEYCGTTTGIYGIGNTVNDTEDCSGGTATCSALAVCDVCEDTHGELDTDAHKWGAAVTDTANAGKHIYTCEYDSDHTKSEDCVSGSTVVVAPKCEEQGYTIQTCKECSYQWNTDYVDATDHNWVDPVDNKDGTHTLSCDNENVDGWVCDETLTLKCADSAITFGLEPPTCLTQGYTTYQCTVCNYTWNADYVDATGHSYDKKLKKLDETYKRSEKTCTEAETYWYRCDNCDVSAETEKDKYADNLASIYWTNGTAAGHKMDKIVDTEDLAKNRVSEANCTKAAVYYYSCTVCGEQDKTQTFSYGSALNHDYQNLVDEDNIEKNRVSEATCTSAAIYNKSCTRCDSVSEETFEYGTKIGHNMTKTDAEEATCTTAGNVEYYTCSNCKKTFSDEAGTTAITKTVIDALGHAWVDVAYKAPTCEEAGYSGHKDCSRCDATLDKTDYAATGHKFTGAYYCDTANNYHSKYCVNDDCTATGIVVDGAQVKYEVEYDGLDYVIKGGEACNFTGEYVNETDENGVHSHALKCVCGNETSDVCADSEPETVAPTCTEDGYTLYICETCAYEWKTDIVTAPGHNLAETATSNGDGTHSVKCSECDYTSDAEDCSTATPSTTCGAKNTCDICKGEFGEEIPHVFTDYKYNDDATCTADGTKTAECDNCDTNATDTVTATGTKLSHAWSEFGYDISKWVDEEGNSLAPEGFDAEAIVEPTCGTEGLAISYCSRCDEYVTKTTSKIKDAHIWGEWTLVGGDCASGVTYIRECTVCGEKESKTETVAHTWAVIAVQEAGCVENGYIDLKCSVCGFTKTLQGEDKADYELDGVNYADKYNVIANGEHVWQTEEPAEGNYIVIDGNIVFVEKYPAYNATGRGYLKCTKCPATEKVEIPAYGNAPENHKHPELGINNNSTLKKVAQVNPTCTVGGHKEYYECTRCSYSQYVLDHDAYYLAALGHTEANEDGKCERCKTTLEEDSASNNCGCIHHKESGFMQFIYKILRFFWKLFGMNKNCACGVAHY